MTWYWIDIGYATFGVQSENGVVINSAPIAKWMIGKSLQEIKLWLKKKRAKIIELPNGD